MSGDIPDCEICPKPNGLDNKNRKALGIWERCHKHREISVGMSVVRQRLKLSEVSDFCEKTGAGMDDFEKVLIIEDIAYPMIVETTK